MSWTLCVCWEPSGHAFTVTFLARDGGTTWYDWPAIALMLRDSWHACLHTTMQALQKHCTVLPVCLHKYSLQISISWIRARRLTIT